MKMWSILKTCFNPVLKSLPYILDQVDADQRPKIYVRCLAQAIDPDDFVHVWGMAGWMSTYEKMVNHFVNRCTCYKMRKWLPTCVLQGGLLLSTTSVVLAFGKEESIRAYWWH